MTPAAITPAGGRKIGTGAPQGKPSAAPGHRRRLRREAAPKSPRRVSGPLQRGARPATTPRRHLGRSAHEPIVGRAIAFVRLLPDHSLLDRLIRGRFWIPLLGLMLVGIVAMQVEVLKLGASMGRSIQHATALESRNELLRTSVASLADEQRIERMAAGMGMVMPAPDGVGFLPADASAVVPRAIANIQPPNAQSFLTLLSTNGTVTRTGPPSTAGSASAKSLATTAPTTATPNPTAPPSQPTGAAPSGIPSGG